MATVTVRKWKISIYLTKLGLQIISGYDISKYFIQYIWTNFFSNDSFDKKNYSLFLVFSRTISKTAWFSVSPFEFFLMIVFAMRSSYIILVFAKSALMSVSKTGSFSNPI